MTRIDRRLRLARCRPPTVPDDAGQRWVEGADRNRAARRVRGWLRRMQPVVLVTPRWSQPARFLDDLATDLALETPVIGCRMLSLSPLQGRGVADCWAWLLAELAGLLALPTDARPALCVDRQGFRRLVADVFARAEQVAADRVAVFLHGGEHLPLQVRADLLEAVAAHADSGRARVTTLLAGAVSGPEFRLPDRDAVWLADFTPAEAVEALAEYTGPVNPSLLTAVVREVGGVPAMVDRIGHDADVRGRLLADRDAVWRTVSAVLEEIGTAIAIASGSEALARRLEQVAAGPQVAEDDASAAADRALIATGLVARHRGRVQVRAPVIAELVLS
jgi:hypothetical protein